MIDGQPDVARLTSRNVLNMAVPLIESISVSLQYKCGMRPLYDVKPSTAFLSRN